MDRLGLSLFLQRTAGLARRMQSASLSEGECFHAERATAVTANLHAARELNGFLQPSFGGGGAGGGGGWILLFLPELASHEPNNHVEDPRQLGKELKKLKPLGVGLTSYPKYQQELPFGSCAFKVHSLQCSSSL